MRAEQVAAAATPAARPHYISVDGHYLFAWHHSPRPAARRGAAVVLCPSLGGEYVRVYRFWRDLAESLADIGFDVFRFEYEGTGDSSGDLDEAERPEAWLRNIAHVIAEARTVTRSREVALVGLRVGATLALHAAATCGGVDRLVLWSPFPSGKAYVRELKALGRLTADPHAAPGDPGPDIHAVGYILPGPVAAALERVDLDLLRNPPARDVLVVDRDDRLPKTTIASRLETLGCRVTRVRPSGTAGMLEPDGLRPPQPAEALDAITTWLADWPLLRPAATVPTPAAPEGSGSARGPSYREHAVCFGPANRLFGVLNVPDDMAGTAPAVIFFNTNYEYRVGPHRLYVPLAREYAARGHVVLRYDLGGVGDSEIPSGGAPNIAYPAHAIDDAREAVAFIRSQAPGRRVIVVGLCSGGWHVFRAALNRLDVDAIVSVNPPLYLREGRAVAHEYHEVGEYRSTIRDRARWANVLRGRIAYGSLFRFCLGYARRKAVSGVRAMLGGRWQEGLARELDAISARGITSLFVFSHGDPSLEYFRLRASRTLVRRRARGRIRYVVVDGAGHTFSPADAQRTLRMLLNDFVAQQSRAAAAEYDARPRPLSRPGQ